MALKCAQSIVVTLRRDFLCSYSNGLNMGDKSSCLSVHRTDVAGIPCVRFFFFFSFCHRTGSLWSEAEEINICKVPNNRLFGSMNGKQKADSMAFANDSDREKAIINGKIYSQQSCRQSSGVD